MTPQKQNQPTPHQRRQDRNSPLPKTPSHPPTSASSPLSISSLTLFSVRKAVKPIPSPALTLLSSCSRRRGSASPYLLSRISLALCTTIPRKRHEDADEGVKIGVLCLHSTTTAQATTAATNRKKPPTSVSAPPSSIHPSYSSNARVSTPAGATTAASVWKRGQACGACRGGRGRRGR